MRAVIPVAGIGTRLKPHTYTTPKVLLNVGGKPMLGHILEKLLEEKVYKATFVIGHLGDQIKDYVKKEYPSIKADFIEQKKMDGLGHAIYTAIPTFDDKEIFIILGDTVFDVYLKDVFKDKQSALGVKKVDDPSRFGVAVLENGYINKLVEKPTTPISNLALVGLYYIANSDALVKSLNNLIKKDIRTKGELQLTDALQMMLDDGEKIKTFDVNGWYDCGKPETLLSTNRFLLDQKSVTKKFENVVVNPPVFIAEDAKIENSVIGPYATIDKGCIIKESVIKNSIVGTNSQVSKAMLNGSIIGNNTIVKGAFKKLNIGDSTEIDFY
ncbi:MAG: nucleotidyl transferase [Ignavibacteria bacterium RIFOXYB2_FULL_35_12]|nr:MAG: nucleotidyl transferase [Ignavibacteria bacterium GWA2_36_19]OGU55457.1 MAG: nucleotidyl transferase [Ignavibacteria bacterium GWC2_35_8]OGU60805.1 MAG: nucleotidyl transferase [Ignavibacteria bacterium GWF2_35_20]OGU80968.1 MAG: nucleotidyl transferase [Ignavibacteria bacterium RBG_16_35_7]OGU81594.1 MAG: nucleotidyl transferase [Ignavibacteria bacterium RIFOXYA2_FULL_35_9]OGU87468.1 MAG: nucleotidyl transferase [Ignavibacteria bacterium RIFOXYA12_FULL_35_25]OGU97305.1 MAG: nucleotid